MFMRCLPFYALSSTFAVSSYIARLVCFWCISYPRRSLHNTPPLVCEAPWIFFLFLGHEKRAWSCKFGPRFGVERSQRFHQQGHRSSWVYTPNAQLDVLSTRFQMHSHVLSESLHPLKSRPLYVSIPSRRKLRQGKEDALIFSLAFPSLILKHP